MCWYVLERYLYCLTNISHYTPEFQKYSLGLGKDRWTQIVWVIFPVFLYLFQQWHYHQPSSPFFSGLTLADLETYDPTGNGTSNEADGDTEAEKTELKEDVKEETTQVATPKHVLTSFELEGLWNLVGKLEELPDHKKCVPDGIRNPTALLRDMKVGAIYHSHTSSMICKVQTNLMFVFLASLCFSRLFSRSVLMVTPSCPTLESPLSGGLKG